MKLYCFCLVRDFLGENYFSIYAYALKLWKNKFIYRKENDSSNYIVKVKIYLQDNESRF